jgi:hypothetical protein
MNIIFPNGMRSYEQLNKKEKKQAKEICLRMIVYSYIHSYEFDDSHLQDRLNNILDNIGFEYTSDKEKAYSNILKDKVLSKIFLEYAKVEAKLGYYPNRDTLVISLGK